VKAGLKVAAVAALFYAAYCLLVFLLQRQVLFPRYLIPAPAAAEPPSREIEVLQLETSFGRVEAWFLAPRRTPGSGPAPAVIFGHGNGELIDYWPGLLAGLPEMGLGLLLVEYPGYGRSAGSPSQAGIAETFRRAYDQLAARPDVDPGRIVLFGRSLGGGAVCDLARQRPAKALVLMSAFTGVRAFAPRFLVPPCLIRDPFDNLEAVRQFHGPVLVIHGRRDEVVPFRHGQALAAAARQGRLIAVEAGHNDCPPDWSAFYRDLAEFFRSAEVLSSAL
jgi:hypothetical protein